MADPRDLNEFGGQRLYRNSLDDILDQVQRDIENERSIANARQNTIINSEDPVQKLKEVQTIEKSVAQETPEIQQTVLNRTYNIPQQPAPTGFLQPNPNPQYTIGQPRGEQQNLTDDDIRFRAELERIQEPFDRIFQEKLKNAKEIKAKSITDPMTGSVFTTQPGKTKEEVAKEQATKELEKQGIIKPQFAKTFLQSFIPLKIPGIEKLSPEQQAQQQEYFPIQNLIGQVGGALAGFKGVNVFLNAPKLIKTGDAVRKGGKVIEETFRRDPGKLTQIGVDLGRKISGTKLGNVLKDKGVAGATIQRFTTGATTGAGTFGAYSLIDQIDEDSPIADKALTITENAIFGAGFGLTGNIANRGARALADGTYGFVTSKLMEGATTTEALLNGLMFAGFGVLNNKNVAEVDRQFAVKDFAKQADDIFVLMQTMRVNAGRKKFTNLQQKQYTKIVEDYANELYGKGVSAKNIEKQTEKFLNRFLQTNDPKGSVAKIRQIGNQSKTQMLQGKAKIKKEAVSVPTTGKADKVSQENVLRLSTGEQLRRIKDLGFTEEQFVRLSGKQRQDILDNSIKEENFVTEQPTRPSMPVPGPAPDATPSTKKSDKLVPEKLEPKPEEVKPEVKPTKGEATGLKTTTLKPSDIKIDESKFQPREEYNQAVIDSIAKNFKAEKWEEPVVWQDPKNNDYYIVDGHHRQRGVVKGGYESATYKVLPKGTTLDQAINISEEGNLGRTPQKDFENGKVVRRRFNEGKSLVSIADALPGLTKAQSNAGKSNAVRKLLNLSYLDNKGKLKSNYDNVNEFPRIQSTSSYIGALRKQYDWIPDRYEDDLFTYLYTENGIRQDDADWKLNLESTLEKLADAKERPGSILKQLRQDPLQPKEGTPDEVLTQIKDLKKSIENVGRNLSDDKFLQGEIARIQEEKGLSEIDALQEAKRDLRKRRAELKTELKELVDDSSKPDPNQGSMFEPVDQYNMFGGIDRLSDLSTKDKKILDELRNELSSLYREQSLFNQQVANNQIGKLKSRNIQKKLDTKFKKTIKQIQKIDKPVNGATAKPGIAVDINEQIQLYLGGKKQTELFRETATNEDKENTKKLQRGLSRLRSRIGITERASSILAPLEKVGASHFIGQKVSGPEELALISQIARDKRYETFRIFFTKSQGTKDKIVNYTAYTNRMPGWVSVYPGPFKTDDATGLEALTQWMYKAMQDAGADGYYLMHNHPSGRIKASKSDIKATKAVAGGIPGFRGHIILNHNKYGLIDSNQNVKELRFDMKDQSISDPLVNEKYYNTMPIHFSTKAIPSLKKFQEDAKTVSIFATDYDYRIHAITDIPLQNFIDVGKKRKYGLGLAKLKTQLRKIASTYGGQRIFLVSKSTDMKSKEVDMVHRVWKRLFKDNFITDGYFFNSYDDPSNYYTMSYGMGRKMVKGSLYFNPGARVPKQLKESTTSQKNTHIAGFEARAEADGIELDLSYNKNLNAVKLHLIKIPKDRRNEGLGTKTMKQVLDYVDDQGLLMTLTPSDAFGSSKRKLVEFYKSFGFRLNSGPYRDLRFRDTMIRKPFKSLKLKEQINSLDEIKIQSNFKNWFGKSKAVDIDGKPEVYYHGTQRPDRIGSVFYKSRAHSGPMSYFTNDPEIASGYAKGKSDDSLIVDDWSNLYSIGREKGLRSAWWQLSDKQKQDFNNKAYKSGLNDDDVIVLDENYNYMDKSTYDYFLKEAKGNGLMAVFRAWIEGGYFIGEEERLLEVFKANGVSNIKYDNPRAKLPAVFPVYLSMQNPLNTDNIPSKIVEGLRKRSKRQPSPKYMQGTTHWDKEARKPEDWIWALNEDVKNNTSSAWTSIPDWVTRYLKQQGYDGIMDVGGKYNPENSHSVAIPFEPNQVKSKFNRGTFSKRSKNIMKEQEKMFKNPASTLSSIKQLETKSEVPQKIYDDAKSKIENKSRLKTVVNLGKTIKKELKEPGTLNRMMTPLSTRLRVLAPELKRAIRRFEFNISINTAKDLKVAENFMKQTSKLRKKNVGDYTVLDLAMKNSDLEKVQEILDKHSMGSEFIKVRNLLDNIYARAEMVGYEPNYLSDYFPRKIKDSDGLMNYLYESDSWGILQSNIKEKEKELGRRLEKDERLKLINNLIRGFGGRLGIQRPANLKEREIEYLNSDLNEFYYDSNTALHRYIVQMNEAIEIKKFFGKGMGPEDPNTQVDNNVVGEYVDTLLDQGVIKPNQQDELINLLRIRFAQGPMDSRIAKMRSGSYLLTMGQVSSSVTQIGDMAWSVYSSGLPQTSKALGKSIVRKSVITKKDIGIDKIAQEFTEVPGASKILDTVFTLSGLNYIDSLGKESLINSTLAVYQKQAKKEKFSSSLQDRLNEAFDKKELPKVIEDLKSGNITDDIKYLAHYTLSDFQPVSLSEMPEWYLKAPNGRIMYMLKSYTLKQFDVIRNESFKKMNEGKTAKEKAEGVRRLIYLASVLMLTGMSADKIKNFMYGREQEFDEMIGDNLLRIFGFNKYLVYVQKRYKNWAYTALKFLAPPVFLLNPLFESAMQDLDKYFRLRKKGKPFKIPQDVKSIKNLPLFGKFYYEYFGVGKEYNMKRKEKEKKKKRKRKYKRISQRPPL